MANTEQNRAIDQDLAQIKNAIYGEEVRDAIIDGIEQCYSDANDVVKVSETQPTEENVKLWVKPESEETVVPTYDEFQEFKNEIDAKLVCPATTDGTYVLQCVVSNGSKTYSWVNQ